MAFDIVGTIVVLVGGNPILVVFLVSIIGNMIPFFPVPYLLFVITIASGFHGLEQYPRLRVPLVAIRYYLQSMLSSCQLNWYNETRGVTNYKPLLLQIDRWVSDEKVLVCFNYDTHLEEALASTLGVKFESWAEYVSETYKVIKPHGSINWWHRVDFPQFPRQTTSLEDERIPTVIDRAQDLKINPAFELLLPTRAIPTGNPTIPALSIPVATKSEYECPDDHQRELAESLRNVTKVLVIGWRATENRFLKSFAQGIGQNSPEFFVVSRNERVLFRLSRRSRTVLETMELLPNTHTCPMDLVQRSKTTTSTFS